MQVQQKLSTCLSLKKEKNYFLYISSVIVSGKTCFFTGVIMLGITAEMEQSPARPVSCQGQTKQILWAGKSDISS